MILFKGAENTIEAGLENGGIAIGAYADAAESIVVAAKGTDLGSIPEVKRYAIRQGVQYS